VYQWFVRVKLIFIERDRRGNELQVREEFLESDSTKSLTRNHVAKLIARHHPEMQHAGGVMLLDASETPYKWFVDATQLGTNRWLYVYAHPLNDTNTD
jgi:hypothetical protein